MLIVFVSQGLLEKLKVNLIIMLTFWGYLNQIFCRKWHFKITTETEINFAEKTEGAGFFFVLGSRLLSHLLRHQVKPDLFPRHPRCHPRRHPRRCSTLLHDRRIWLPSYAKCKRTKWVWMLLGDLLAEFLSSMQRNGFLARQKIFPPNSWSLCGKN